MGDEEAAVRLGQNGQNLQVDMQEEDLPAEREELLAVQEDPSKCAISYDQLMEVERQAKRRYGCLAYYRQNMHNIAEDIIVPLCEANGFQFSYALSLNKPSGLMVEAFVTHCWDEPFAAFVESIRTAFRHYTTKPNLWICSFALVQGDRRVTERLLDSPSLDNTPFVQALRAATSFLVVRNSKKDLYSRVWCICELMYANEYNFTTSAGKTMVVGSNKYRKNQSSCLEAEASDPDDKKRIMDLLQEKHGEERINELVRQYRSMRGNDYARRRSLIRAIMAIAVGAAALSVVLVLGLPDLQSEVHNDKCSNSRVVEKVGFSYKDETDSAGQVETSALACFPVIQEHYRGVWFQVTGSASPGICTKVSASSPDFIPVLAAYTGPCQDLSCIAFSETAKLNSTSKNVELLHRTGGESSLLLPNGRVTYHVLVSGGSTGIFELVIKESSCAQNDACRNAATILSLPYRLSSDTFMATSEAHNLSCPLITSLSRGVWYDLASLESTCATVTVEASDFLANLAVFEGEDCNALYCVGSGEVPGGETSSRFTWQPQSGAEYRVLVAGQAASTGQYNISIEENECYTCQKAVDVVVDEWTYSGVGDIDLNFPLELSDMQLQCPIVREGDHGVWFSVKAHTGNCLTFSTAGSEPEFDTAVCVFEGSCQNLSYEIHNDNRRESQSSKSSTVTINPRHPGRDYMVLVSGKAGATGRFSLAVMEEKCDRCQNAIRIGSIPFNDQGSTVFAEQIELIDNDCYQVDREHTRGVWYKLDNLGTGKCMKASTAGSEMDTLIAIYEPEDEIQSCESLVCLNGNNNVPEVIGDPDPSRSEVFWKTKVGVTLPYIIPADYFLMVGGRDGSVGNYNLTITEYQCLPNDDCDGAIPIPTIPFTVTGTTIGATEEGHDARRCSVVLDNRGQRGVFYEIIGTGKCLSASLEADYNTAVAVYEGNCGDLTCVEQSKPNNREQRSSWHSRSGVLYKVLVTGFEDYTGNFNLTIQECEPKNECIDAFAILSLPFSTSDVINDNITETYWHTDACSNYQLWSNNGYGHWYELNGTGSCLAASTINSSMDDTMISVYVGEDCNALKCVDENDDLLDDWRSRVTWRSNQFEKYKIFVSGVDEERGPYKLSVSEITCPNNDDCSNATNVEEIPFAVEDSTLNATGEDISILDCLVRPSASSDFSYSLHTPDLRGVWYKIDSRLGSCFIASVDGSNFSPRMALFEGESCRDSLQCQGFNQSHIRWETQGRIHYRLLIVGAWGEVGPFKLNITVWYSLPPAVLLDLHFAPYTLATFPTRLAFTPRSFIKLTTSDENKH